MLLRIVVWLVGNVVFHLKWSTKVDKCVDSNRIISFWPIVVSCILGIWIARDYFKKALSKHHSKHHRKVLIVTEIFCNFWINFSLRSWDNFIELRFKKVFHFLSDILGNSSINSCRGSANIIPQDTFFVKFVAIVSFKIWTPMISLSLRFRYFRRRSFLLFLLAYDRWR